MYLTERQKRILSLLLASKEWMTGAEIGRRLGITDRTVRKDIREINESLKEYKGSHIDSCLLYTSRYPLSPECEPG